MIHVFLISLMLFWTQSPNSSLTLIVRDGADQPVVGLTLTLRDGNSTHQVATTDASGRATFMDVRGLSITLTEAISASGQPIKLDPTTPTDGLVLGLIPGATRVVPFRLVDGLLFLDPLEVFAGTDESAHSAPTLAALPLAPTSASDAVAVPERTADRPDTTATQGVLLWCIGVPLLCLLCLTALLIVTRRRR